VGRFALILISRLIKQGFICGIQKLQALLFRQPLLTASCAVQNQRSPYRGSIFVGL
jgi:hypothetical protein